MADISLTAFVEDVVRGQDGTVFVLKTAETHSRKGDDGKYVTVSRTFRDVKVARNSGITLEYGKGDRVQVAGREVTEKRTVGEKDYFSLVVWADSVEPAGSYGSQRPVEAAVSATDWEAENTPF